MSIKFSSTTPAEYITTTIQHMPQHGVQIISLLVHVHLSQINTLI
jgi:hypothetical protein